MKNLPNQLTDRDEALLQQSVSRITDLILDGMGSTDALVKVAREKGMYPGTMRTVGEMINVSSQLRKYAEETSTLQKFRGVDLIDMDKAIAEVWSPSHTPKVAADISPVYSTDPRKILRKLNKPATVKTAKENKVTVPVAKPAAPAKSLETTMRQTKLAMWQDLKDIATYLTTAGSVSFNTLKAAAVSRHGELGGEAVDTAAAYTRIPKTKQAVKREFLPESAEPVLSKVASAVQKLLAIEKMQKEVQTAKQAEEAHALKTFLKDKPRIDLDLITIKQSALSAPMVAAEPSVDIVTPLRPFMTSNATGKIDIDSINIKLAAILPMAAMATSANSAMSNYLGSLVKERKDLLKDEIESLSDPDTESQIRGIDTAVMLTEAMSDPHNPLSSVPPLQVMQAYNDLSQIAPHLAKRPAIANAALARMTQGNMPLFEYSSMVDIDKSLDPDARKKVPNAQE